MTTNHWSYWLDVNSQCWYDIVIPMCVEHIIFDSTLCKTSSQLIKKTLAFEDIFKWWFTHTTIVCANEEATQITWENCEQHGWTKLGKCFESIKYVVVKDWICYNNLLLFMFVSISHLIKPPYHTLHKKIHPIGSGKERTTIMRTYKAINNFCL